MKSGYIPSRDSLTKSYRRRDRGETPNGKVTGFVTRVMEGRYATWYTSGIKKEDNNKEEWRAANNQPAGYQKPETGRTPVCILTYQLEKKRPTQTIAFY